MSTVGCGSIAATSLFDHSCGLLAVIASAAHAACNGRKHAARPQHMHTRAWCYTHHVWMGQCHSDSRLCHSSLICCMAAIPHEIILCTRENHCEHSNNSGKHGTAPGAGVCTLEPVHAHASERLPDSADQWHLLPHGTDSQTSP